MGTAAALTSCSKNETQEEELNNMATSKITLTFNKEEVNNRSAQLNIEFLEYSDPNKKEAFVDLNGNLKKDEGEDLKQYRNYNITKEKVNIIGGKFNRLGIGSNQLTTVEINHKELIAIAVFYSPALTSVKVGNAQQLAELQISDNENLAHVTLPANKNLIANLIILNINDSNAIQNREQLFESLPDRTGKEPKGKVFLSSSLTKKEGKILSDLNWGVE